MTQENEVHGRSIFFYLLMAHLIFLVTFLGYKFGDVFGAIVGLISACIVNGYALKIKFD
jgi:uncharacterized membrane protein YgaE (UPF0421/DUF939 family)